MEKKNKINSLLILAVLGLIAAGATFLIAFITTQKAAMPNKYKDLRIPPISEPVKPAIPPVNLPLVVEESTSASNQVPEPETEQITPTPDSSQSATSATENL